MTAMGNKRLCVHDQKVLCKKMIKVRGENGDLSATDATPVR